jgi:hypothetical protein
MKVQLIRDSCKGAPQTVAEQGFRDGNTRLFKWITFGKIYEVHAMILLLKGEIGFCIVPNFTQYITPGDTRNIKWLPSWFFKVVDHTMPDDWECHSTINDGIIIGPAFISESHEAYCTMVDLYPDQRKRFWDRIERLRIERGESADVEICIVPD